ncbi:acyl-CoA thioesterase [Thermodesulfobacteriota bacterium]
MLTHRTTCRVIYGDTDNMGVAYHANYLRWFEMGRTEMFRFLGLSYKSIEAKGVFLPVSEVHCKFKSPAHYDDVIVIETTFDTHIRGAVKFDYLIFSEDGKTLLVRGYTKHACLNSNGRVIRPPEFLVKLIGAHSKAN